MITLSCEQLGALFPAYAVVDSQTVVVEVGPSLRRLFPELVPGTILFDHFSSAVWDRRPDLGFFAETGSAIQIESIAERFVLMGTVLRSGALYLLALNHVPAAETFSDLALNMADFGHSDPVVGAYLQIGMLQGLLEETKQNALDLVRERERGVELVNRIKASAGFLAHDFNNLNSIIELNSLNALKAGNLPADQEQRIRVILESVIRSIEITQALNIVATQKYDSGFAEDIDELIRENWPYFRMIAGPGTALLNDLRIGPIKTKVSRNGLVQCLTNVLMNAREAMAGGAGSILISTYVDRQVGRVFVEVSDTGLGMEASVLNSAFESFFTTKDSGHGIGLTSVLDFAREMGGDANLTSIPSEGTQVCIWLPLLDSQQKADQYPAVAGSESSFSKLAAPKSILVVEDEPDALEALSELLADEGYAVTPATSAEAALTELARTNFDVLLTDVVMPDLDGRALAERASRRCPGLKIVLMSGFVPEFLDLRQDWLFCRKPLDVDLLRGILGDPLIEST